MYAVFCPAFEKQGPKGPLETKFGAHVEYMCDIQIILAGHTIVNGFLISVLKWWQNSIQIHLDDIALIHLLLCIYIVTELRLEFEQACSEIFNYKTKQINVLYTLDNDKGCLQVFARLPVTCRGMASTCDVGSQARVILQQCLSARLMVQPHTEEHEAKFVQVTSTTYHQCTRYSTHS